MKNIYSKILLIILAPLLFFQTAEAQGIKQTTWNAGTVFDSTGYTNPPPPTSGIVDDAANTFTFALAVGYVLADHEYSINGGTTYNAVTVNPISVGNVALSVGQLKVRVKAATGRNASTPLSNGVAFTVAGSGSVKTDTATYLAGTAPTLGIAGTTTIDPVFGTTVMRITDANTGSGATYGTAYSYWSSFNADNSKLLAFSQSGGQSYIYNFDPIAFSLGTKTAISGPPGGTGIETAIWSTNNADALYQTAGAKLYKYRPSTGAWTVVADLTSALAASAAPTGTILQQPSLSANDDVLGFTIQNSSYTRIGYGIYKISTSTMLYSSNNVNSSVFDEVAVDKSGRFLVVKTGLSLLDSNPSTIEVRVVDTQPATPTVVDLTNGSPDYSPGHSDSGSGFVVGAEDWNGRLTRRSLATPHTFTTLFTYGFTYGHDYHVSMLANADTWVMSTTYGASSAHFMDSELHLIKTDGTGTIRRFCHHYSVYEGATDPYAASPRGNISRDGKFAAFSSNWGNATGRVDLFVVRIPDSVYAMNFYERNYENNLADNFPSGNSFWRIRLLMSRSQHIGLDCKGGESAA